jgi:hypothetical protein
MKNKNFISLLVVMGLVAAIPVFANSIKTSQRLDFINIGSPTSEIGHNLQGWGPIEPATNSGTWGQIIAETDCGLPAGGVCDKALRVTYAGSELDHPTINGRMASFSFNLKNNRWGLVTSLKMRVLDGIANDDFVVYVKNERGNWEQVYSYISDASTNEVWKVHTINLPIKDWFKKTLEVAVMSTGDTWSQHATYGQLGVDWVELIGVGVKGGGNNDNENQD